MTIIKQTSLCAVLLLILSAAINAQTVTKAQTTVSSETATSVIAPAAQPLLANATPQVAASKPAVSAKTPNAGRSALATENSTSDSIAAAIETKTSNEALAKAQEAQIAADIVKLDELRKLVADGLVARVELENAQALLAGLRTNLETSKKNIADSERMIADLRKAEEMAKVQPLLPVAKTAGRSFLKPTVLRHGGERSWSLGGLGAVQSFFMTRFGELLPVSAVGQSATHNRLGYDHRNAVDVALHPDSAQGQALISYLQSQGIPFLAFRAAVAGVATGPHIHIGNPSHRI